MNASLMDMTCFVRMMMGGGSLDGKTIVSGQTARRIQSTCHELAESEMPEIFQILRSAQYPDEVGRVGYGLGLANVEYFGATYSFHGGSIDGMTSWMMWSPERDIGVVVLTNSGNIAYPAWAAFAAVNAGAGLPADTTLVRLAGLRDQVLADPPHPEPASNVPPIVPLSELYGDYANRLGAFSIRPGDNGKATLTFPETGFVADVTPLGGRDYWVDLRNPALPDFGLTLTSQPGEDKAILAESPSELPPLFASDPAFVRRSR
jgi:hypothetical protein